MTTDQRIALVRMALDAIREGRAPNLDLARGCLVEALDGLNSPPAATARAGGRELVTIKAAARRLSFSSRHLRDLIAAGKLEGAVVGSGRATRIVLGRAVEALKANGSSLAKEPDDVVAKELEAFRRREGLVVVAGGKAP